MPFELHLQRYPRPNGEGRITADEVTAYASLEEWLEADPPADEAEFRRRDQALTISLEEWQEAVEATEGVRLVEGRACSRGSAEVEIGGTWTTIFTWRKDGIQLNGLGEYYEDPRHPVRVAASALARRLGAVINDDDFSFVHW